MSLHVDRRSSCICSNEWNKFFYQSFTRADTHPMLAETGVETYDRNGISGSELTHTTQDQDHTAVKAIEQKIRAAISAKTVRAGRTTGKS